eukprot:4938449-Alexandrium_andersonii.AAC.1
MQHFDLGHAKTDHYPVSLRASFRQERTPDVPLRRAPIVDAAAATEPAALATFRAALGAVPCISAADDPHSHMAAIT